MPMFPSLFSMLAAMGAVWALYCLWSAAQYTQQRRLPLRQPDWAWWALCTLAGIVMGFVLPMYCQRYGSASGSCFLWWLVVMQSLLALGHARLLHLGLRHQHHALRRICLIVFFVALPAYLLLLLGGGASFFAVLH